MQDVVNNMVKTAHRYPGIYLYNISEQGGAENEETEEDWSS